MSIDSNIKPEMIQEFNRIMEKNGSIIRLQSDNFSTIDIKLVADKYVKDSTLNLSNDFYVDLQDFFKSRGVEDLRFNNMGSCFWSMSATK